MRSATAAAGTRQARMPPTVGTRRGLPTGPSTEDMPGAPVAPRAVVSASSPTSFVSESSRRPIPQTLKEYGRATAGGLLFASASLYTMEIWWQGYTVPSHIVFVRFLGVLALLTAYSHYDGLHDGASLWHDVFEAFEAIALGFLITVVTLKLAGQLPSGIGGREAIQRVVMAGGVTAIGVAVGTAQLGAEDDDEDEDASHGGMLHGLALSVLGAFLIGSSVAPTEEILMIGSESPGWAALAAALLSYVLALGIVSYVQFRGSGRVGEITGHAAADAVVTYAVALTVSAYLLWSTGQFEGLGGLAALDLVVYLGFPCTLGAAAGRLLL
ncbi:MAG: TIGR02587 family membrane protein [Rhodothermaceae bacterium]|mgnify:CR=1 FL=1|nr:TIGR02587 family membrane protein [Rhodothermaceae bacterium]MBC14410.1 TIGR02587 family membrane protein [Rhodothermaceae bacterium]